MRSIELAVCLLLLAGGLAACQGRIAPLSAQAGSTILIPFDGEGFLSLTERSRVGYGGRDVSDPQRGGLVYRLDGPSGFELVTLGSTRVRPEADAFGLIQLVSLVEIPLGAPLGSHALFVAHRRLDPVTGSIVEQPGPNYEGQLRILPAEIAVNLPGGGSELIEGSPTPLEAFADLVQWIPISQVSSLQAVVPEPELRISLNSDKPIWAANVVVWVPAAVAEVLGVRATGSSLNPAVVWLEDAGLFSGVHVYVGHAAAIEGPIGNLAFPFRLVDGSAALLDPASVLTIGSVAWDKDGNRLPTVSASSVTIF